MAENEYGSASLNMPHRLNDPGYHLIRCAGTVIIDNVSNISCNLIEYIEMAFDSFEYQRYRDPEVI